MKKVFVLLVVGVGVVAVLLAGRFLRGSTVGSHARGVASGRVSGGEGVEGFQNLKWGMSIDDVKKDPVWAQASLKGDQGSRIKTLISVSKVEVQGEKVPLAMALFIDGNLESVGLTYDLSWERVSNLFSVLNKKYSGKDGSLESYQESALNTGLDPKIRVSWENDTIVLNSDSLPGIGKTLLLTYKKVGMREKMVEIQRADAKKNVKDL